MKNIISLCFLLLLAWQGKSQNVFGSVGGEGQAGSMNVQYTVGETSVTTVENDSTLLTQGFHQPNLTVTALEAAFLPGTLTVFPNPTAGVINVQFADIPLENIVIVLFDLAGKQLLTAQANADRWQADLSDWAGGYYLLRVTDTVTKQSNSFKIFKSN